MTLLQQCSNAHAAAIATEMGMDVRSVRIELAGATQNGTAGAEKSNESAVPHESKVVAYIEAPQATEEEVVMFAQRLQKECPMARQMGSSVEWRKK